MEIGTCNCSGADMISEVFIHRSFFFLLWYVFIFKIHSAGTSLVEDICQCLEAEYLRMSNLNLKKNHWQSISYSLLGKHCIYDYCWTRKDHFRFIKKNEETTIFWKCICMITLPVTRRIFFFYFRCYCASIWALCNNQKERTNN